ncbi:MAG: hypothetical protein QXU32_11060 [Nitrososphaerales archaeon]
MKVLGTTLNLPVLVETSDEHSKLEPLLHAIKRIVDDDGLVTLDEGELI